MENLEHYILNPRFIPKDNARMPNNCFMFETMRDLDDKDLSTHIVPIESVDLYSITYKNKIYQYDGIRFGKEIYSLKNQRLTQ